MRVPQWDSMWHLCEELMVDAGAEEGVAQSCLEQVRGTVLL